MARYWIMYENTPRAIIAPYFFKPWSKTREINFIPYESRSGLSFERLYLVDLNNGLSTEITKPTSLKGVSIAKLESTGTELGYEADTPNTIYDLERLVALIARLSPLAITSYTKFAIHVETYRCHSWRCSYSKIHILANPKEFDVILGRPTYQQGHLYLYQLPFTKWDVRGRYIREYLIYNHHFDGHMLIVDNISQPAGLSVYIIAALSDVKITSQDHDPIEIPPAAYLVVHRVPPDTSAD